MPEEYRIPLPGDEMKRLSPGEQLLKALTGPQPDVAPGARVAQGPARGFGMGAAELKYQRDLARKRAQKRAQNQAGRQPSFPMKLIDPEDVPDDLGDEFVTTADVVSGWTQAKEDLAVLHAQGGPFLRVLNKWGITPDSSYGKAASGIWDAFEMSNRGDVGKGITREDLGDLRQYLVTRRMAEDPASPWVSERPFEGETDLYRGSTSKDLSEGDLPSHSWWFGRQQARQQAEWDLLKKIIGPWDPRVNQPNQWRGGHGAYGRGYSPRLNQMDPTGPSGVLDEFLRLKGISEPRYLSPEALQEPFMPKRGRLHDLDWSGPGL